MGGYAEREGDYAVPTYKAGPGAAWYHFLHGNVPGHQIDFMYRPEVPQGPLTRQHFSHLSRLIKYIEPHTNNPFAFAIGNLSRDDTQYEPGHGGLAMIFGFRIEGVTDHAGRQDPPFAHGIATVDRHLDKETIFAAARAFYSHLFSRSKQQENPSTVLYQEYVRFASKNASVLPTVLNAYVEDFSDLPIPESSRLTSKWLADEAAQPKRVAIVHPNDAPFDALASCAARIAAMLYQSDIKWSAITNGRESDLPGGVTVRLVAKRDAGGHEASGGLVLPINEVPIEEGEIAAQLFKARPARRDDEAAPVQQGWRARIQAKSGPASNPPPPMGGAQGEMMAPPFEPPDSGGQDGRRGVGDARLEADGAPPAPSSKKEIDLAARPRNRPREGNEAEPVAAEKAAEALVARADADAPAQPVGAVTAGASSTQAGGVGGENALITEREKLEDVAATPAPTRSRAWIWIGLALICAAVVPAAIMVTRQPEAQPDLTPGPTTTSPAPQPTAPPTPTSPSQPTATDNPPVGNATGVPPAATPATTPEPESTSKRRPPPKGPGTEAPPPKEPRNTPAEQPSTSTPKEPTSPKPTSTKAVDPIFEGPLIKQPPKK